MPLRVKQIAATAAVVGATIVGGAGLVAAQDSGDDPTTTVPDESTPAPDGDRSGDRHAPSENGRHGGPGGHPGRGGEGCPENGDHAARSGDDADDSSEADTQASSLAA